MLSIILENDLGASIDLSSARGYQVKSVTGIDPPKAQINTTQNALVDGATFNSAKLTARNIVISLTIEEPCEANRIALYQYVKPKRKVNVRLRNNRRSVMAEGYVESIAVDYWAKKETAQISIICPDPALYDESGETRIDFSVVQSLFEFPFDIGSSGIAFSEVVAGSMRSVTNIGDLPTGFIVQFHAIGTAGAPALYNSVTGEMIKINRTITAGQTIEVDTRTGKKTVTLISGGTRTNILNQFTYDSDWMQLEAGDNILQASATTHPENVETYIFYTPIYEGM